MATVVNSKVTASGLHDRAASRIEIAAVVTLKIFPAALTLAARRPAPDHHERRLNGPVAEVAIGVEILAAVRDAFEAGRFRIGEKRDVRNDEEVFQLIAQLITTVVQDG